MGVDIIAEELSQLCEEQCYRTADLYLMLAEFGKRPKWLEPLERSRIELDTETDYVLGIGVVERDREKKETGTINLRHVFPVSSDDLKGLASILRKTQEISHIVTYQGRDVVTLNLRKYLQVKEATGAMLDYDFEPGKEEEIKRFCKL